jgi:hypothetical protein
MGESGYLNVQVDAVAEEHMREPDVKTGQGWSLNDGGTVHM